MRRLLALLLLLLPGPALGWGAPAASPGTLCRAAIATAEREFDLPPGLLGAIGRVESSRRDPATGEVGPWPWTLNVEGRGAYFDTRSAAIAELRQVRARGARSVDVGCLQINLHHHPDAFATPEEGLEPLANARYAARFLRQLHAAADGDWLLAAGRYHSHTPHLRDAYRAQVALRWPEERGRADQRPAWQPGWSSPRPAARPASPLPVASAAPLPFRGGTPAARILRAPAPAPPAGAFSGEAGRGRGLDSYRALAIPLAAPRAPPVPEATRAARG